MSTTESAAVAGAFGPRDDLRHRPVTPGGRMRDSLFWEMVMPDEGLGAQVYLYLTDRGRTGYNVTVWGGDAEPLALELGGGTVGDDTDLDDFAFDGLTVSQPELRRTVVVTYTADHLRMHYEFAGVHDAFSYHQNPDGIPTWFALNRLEQSGRVTATSRSGRRAGRGGSSGAGAWDTATTRRGRGTGASRSTGSGSWPTPSPAAP